MRLERLIATMIFAVAVVPAVATDHPEDAAKLMLKGTQGDGKLLWIAKIPAPVLPASDPRSMGATLRVIGDTDAQTVSLPAAGWSLNGAATLYKFLNRDAPLGTPVRIALVKSGALVKILAKGTVIDIVGVGSSSVSVVLTIGNDVYCSACDTPTINDPSKSKFLAKACPAPMSCPLQSTTTSTVESTSTTETTSSTTSTSSTETSTTSTTSTSVFCAVIGNLCGSCGAGACEYHCGGMGENLCIDMTDGAFGPLCYVDGDCPPPYTICQNVAVCGPSINIGRCRAPCS